MAIKKGLLKKQSTAPDGVYPYTATDCVFDSNGTSLDSIIGTNIINLGVLNDCNLSNLNAYYTYFGQTNANTQNKPSTAASTFVITKFSDVNSYGRQLAIDDIGVYTRELTNGTWGSWQFVYRKGNVKPYVYAQIVYGSVVQQTGKNVAVSAPDVDGYNFSHWAACATSGWVGSIYPADPTTQSTNFWVAAVHGSGSTSTGGIRATAVNTRRQD